jgi:hypothetical protein
MSQAPMIRVGAVVEAGKMYAQNVGEMQAVEVRFRNCVVEKHHEN